MGTYFSLEDPTSDWTGCHDRQTVAEQPHAAIGELDKVHAPNPHRRLKVSDCAPKVRRAVADAGRWAALT